ncbi:oligoribonuclease isoform X3 [Manihot esculenta]|uniref:oligoribonuclease isoform X3 n=1 Tax=Manihot esculenta TaxID=3983 RepID=UPI000B5D1642|nr:oligoribonuclease isoform X3 [Manihot esculenta]
MDRLSNAFSVLDLDAEDDQVDAVMSSSVSSSTQVKPVSTNKTETSRNIVNGSLSGLEIENGKQIGQNLVTSAVEYKMPLVWIDMEMTGLNIEVDRILEIACIITDGNLTKSVEGPDLVIHQSKECLEKMGEWCQSHHAASGLTEKVLESSVSEEEAEKQKYMPDLASLFSHVVVDVSSVKALCIRWYPRDHRKAPSKENKHRAMDDIKESIRELKFYKENIFKAKSKK